jgi:transcriptional regulator with XRE-family HTH domain
MTKRRTLEQAIGGEIRRRREDAGARQEALAFAAQGFGLNWTQPTVAAIENGRRALSLGEAGLLGMIATFAGLSPRLRLLDFIPDTDEQVIVAPGHEAQLKKIRWLYGTLDEQEGIRGDHQAVRVEPIITEADRKAARALRVNPETVRWAAFQLWGHGLVEERDRLVADPAATAQKRGRVTRGLVARLRARIKAGKPRTTRRKAHG